MSDSTSKPTFKGSCLCQAITYEIAIEPTNRKATRCNCAAACQKSCYTNLEVAKDDFKLLTPGAWDKVANYKTAEVGINRYFCATCGTHVLREGFYEHSGQRFDFFKVNLLTIDQPQQGLDLRDFEITYVNGLTNTWELGPKPFPGGTY